MKYAVAARRDSMPAVLPLLLATGTLSLLAIAWRERTARRRTRREALLTRRRTARARSSSTHDESLRGGTGPLVHRCYEIALPDRAVTRDIVLRLMQLHLTELAPAALANFEKSDGSDEVFRVGDEYELTMLGPWNGAVRVTDMTTDRFTLVTLGSHPEAGHITFSVADDGEAPGTLRVRIESWARPRADTAALRPVGRQVQTEVWTTFLQRLAVLAGVSTRPEVHITASASAEAEPGA